MDTTRTKRSAAWAAPHDAFVVTFGAGIDSPAVRLVQRSQRLRRWNRMLAGLFLLGAICILALPWQQTARGRGKVIAWAPADRQQTIDAPISGRLMKWFVYEGTRVRAGDLLCEIQNNDPQWLVRLEEQRSGYEDKLAAAEAKVAQYAAQVESLSQGREQDIASAQEKVRAAENAVAAAEQAVEAAKANQLQAELNHERQQELAEDGISSQLDFEIARRVFETAQADFLSKEASLREKRADLASKTYDVQKVANDDQAKVDAAQAYRREAEGDLSVARADLAKITNTLAQQQTYLVRAPRAGTVLRLLQAQGTAQVKEAEAVAVLVPDTTEPVVELLVQGLDVPLVQPGQAVRLQFEGWPAIQLAGWPNVAVGTFGGVVKMVDATDNGQGRFRILVQPDPSKPNWPNHQLPDPDQPLETPPSGQWIHGFHARFVNPQATYLRQGVQAQGWVLLNRVPLWFEIWRRLNGFTPVVADDDVKKDKPDKSDRPSSVDKTDKADKKSKPPIPK